MKPSDYKLALIVLPECEVNSLHLQRIHRALKYRFPGLETVDVCVEDEYLTDARDSLQNQQIVGFSATRFWEYPIAVIVLGDNDRGAGHNRIDFNLCRVYEADRWGMLRHCSLELDEIEYPKVNSHIFNKLASGLGNERITYFPYGYSSQYVGLGPIDAFGHRIDGNIRNYIDREPNHILIAVFGGSAAWSTHTLHDEMFPALLERRLTEFFVQSEKPVKVSVLNFSQPSAVTLNNIITYLLFCFEIKPNIVLAHCGANDLAFGQTSDRFLLSEHKIAYQFQLERWAELLQSKNEKWSIEKQWESAGILTYPRQILEAFVSRIKQFEELVSQSGNYFIAGLQPTIYSKSNLSHEEARWKKESEAKFWGPALKNLDFLYSELIGKFPKMGCEHFINVHKEFGRPDFYKTHFCDAIHTSPAGDQLIAEIYATYIWTNILKAVPKQ
jgi:hypothetical protein